MATFARMIRPALLTALSLYVVLPAYHAETQETDQEQQGEGDDRGDRDRRSRWEFDDTDTSENNRMLERILERYPDSDKDENGILDATEGKDFIESWRERRREQWRNRRGNRLRPTYNDIAYGENANQVIDLYLAESEEPTPLVIYFHGGQFITGDERDLGTLQVKDLLAAGISVASVDYRDTSEAPFPTPFEDAAKALQFLRFYASQINVDPTRIAGHGEEAGGNLALYLAMHDNLALPRSEIEKLDPEAFAYEAATAEGDEKVELPSILPEVEDEEAQASEKNSDRRADEDLSDELLYEGPRPWEHPAIAAESTRLVAAVARHPIATFDPREWKRLRLPMNDHERLMQKYLNVRYLDPVDDEDVMALVEQVSPLALASEDDPEVLLMSQYRDLELKDNMVWTIMRHHPKQSQLIASALRGKGVRATVRYRGMRNDPGTTSVEFFTKKLQP